MSTLEQAMGPVGDSLEAFAARGGCVVLHAGTPKTGTTTLQRALHQNATSLAAQGFCYPSNILNDRQPKHDWFPVALSTGDPGAALRGLGKAIKEADRQGSRALLLSSELVYASWNDYRTHAGPLLRAIASIVPFRLWLVLREPIGFVASLYEQVLRLNRIPGTPLGLPISLDDALEDPWFLARLDYDAFVLWWEDVAAVPVDVDVYSADMTGVVQQRLAVPLLLSERANASFGLGASSLLIELNSEVLDQASRARALLEWKQSASSSESGVDPTPAQQQRIRQIFRP